MQFKKDGQYTREEALLLAESYVLDGDLLWVQGYLDQPKDPEEMKEVQR